MSPRKGALLGAVAALIIMALAASAPAWSGGTTSCSCPEIHCKSGTAASCAATCTSPEVAECSCGECRGTGGYVNENFCECK